MQQCAIRQIGFFKSGHKFSEAVDPVMKTFHDPHSWFVFVLFRNIRFVFAPRPDVRDIAVLCNHVFLPDITRVQTEVLFSFARRNHYFFVKHLGQHFAVMDICPAYDNRERDAICVDRAMPFASIFSPCPSGLPQRILLRAEPPRWRCAPPAISMKCPPFRHIPQARRATTPQKNQLSTIPENGCAMPRSPNRRISHGEARSISGRCATHTATRKNMSGRRMWVCDPRLVCEGISCRVHGEIPATGAIQKTIVHRISPRGVCASFLSFVLLIWGIV